jgi:hypothetical protein
LNNNVGQNVSQNVGQKLNPEERQDKNKLGQAA